MGPTSSITATGFSFVPRTSFAAPSDAAANATASALKAGFSFGDNHGPVAPISAPVVPGLSRTLPTVASATSLNTAALDAAALDAAALDTAALDVGSCSSGQVSPRFALSRPAAGFVFTRLSQLADALMTGDDARYLLTPAAAAAVAVTPDAAAAVGADESAGADGAAPDDSADVVQQRVLSDDEFDDDGNGGGCRGWGAARAAVRLASHAKFRSAGQAVTPAMALNSPPPRWGGFGSPPPPPLPPQQQQQGGLGLGTGLGLGLGVTSGPVIPRTPRPRASRLERAVPAGASAQPFDPFGGPPSERADVRVGVPRPAAMAGLARLAPLPHRPLTVPVAATAAAAAGAADGRKSKGAPVAAAAPLFPHPDDALLWCSCDAFCAAFLAHSGRGFASGAFAGGGFAGGALGCVSGSCEAWLGAALGPDGAAPRAWPHAVAAAVLLRFNALRVAERRAALRGQSASGRSAGAAMSTHRTAARGDHTRPTGCFASKPLVAALPALLALAHKPPAPAADGAVNAAAARAHRVFVYLLLQTLGQLDPGAAGMPWAAAEAARDDLASAPGAAGAAALALRVVATAADGGALLHALSFLGLLLPRQRGALKEADVAVVVALLQKLLPRSEADVAAAVDAGELDLVAALYWVLRQLLAVEHKDVPALLCGGGQVLALLKAEADSPQQVLAAYFAETVTVFFGSTAYDTATKTAVASSIHPALRVVLAADGAGVAKRSRVLANRLVATLAGFRLMTLNREEEQ